MGPPTATPVAQFMIKKLKLGSKTYLCLLFLEDGPSHSDSAFENLQRASMFGRFMTTFWCLLLALPFGSHLRMAGTPISGSLEYPVLSSASLTTGEGHGLRRQIGIHS